MRWIATLRVVNASENAAGTALRPAAQQTPARRIGRGVHNRRAGLAKASVAGVHTTHTSQVVAMTSATVRQWVTTPAWRTRQG